MITVIIFTVVAYALLMAAWFFFTRMKAACGPRDIAAPAGAAPPAAARARGIKQRDTAASGNRIVKIALWAILMIICVAAAAQCFYGSVWPKLERKAIGILIDPTYSMIDPDLGRNPETLVNAKRIVEGKILQGCPGVGSVVVYPVCNDFIKQHAPLTVNWKVTSSAITLPMAPKRKEYYSDYMSALTSLGQVLYRQQGDRWLFVVGDLIHQIVGDPDPRTGQPPLPLPGEENLFARTHVVLIYPDTRENYAATVLPFWEKYFTDRSTAATLISRRSFESVPFSVAQVIPPYVQQRPIAACLITFGILVALTFAFWRTNKKKRARQQRTVNAPTSPATQ